MEAGAASKPATVAAPLAPAGFDLATANDLIRSGPASIGFIVQAITVICFDDVKLGPSRHSFKAQPLIRRIAGGYGFLRRDRQSADLLYEAFFLLRGSGRQPAGAGGGLWKAI
jgi:hypothetical protein